MSFSDRYGITQILDDAVNNLAISWDTAEDEDSCVAVLLFTPDMQGTHGYGQGTDHYHITIERDQAKVLRDWLDAFLNGGAPNSK